MITKILSGVIIFLIVVSGYLLISNNNIRSDYNEAKQTITNLEDANDKMQFVIERIAKLREEESKIVSNNQEEYKALDELYENLKTKISEKGSSNEEKKDSKKNGNDSNALDPVVSGMLKDVCERVRGSPCPNP